MTAERLFSIVASFLVALLLTSCKDNPSEPQPGTSITGTWLVESIDGQPAGDVGATFVIGTSTISHAQAADGCHAVMSYVTRGDKLITTVTQAGCESELGERDTMTYEVKGDYLTIRGDGVVVLKRISGKDRVIGSWQVTKADGQPPRPGVEVRAYFNDQVFAMNTHAPEGNCTMAFSYQNDGSRLALVTLIDECAGIPPGSEDVVTWTVEGDKLTLVFSSGTTLEAKRI